MKKIEEGDSVAKEGEFDIYKDFYETRDYWRKMSFPRKVMVFQTLMVSFFQRMLFESIIYFTCWYYVHIKQ